MVLYHFHRVLISAAILGDLTFTMWCVRAYNRADAATRQAWGFFDSPLVWGIGSTVIVVGMAGYLIHFNRSLAHLRAVLNQPLRCEACGYDLRGSIDHSRQPRDARDTCPECGARISESVRRLALER